LEAAAHDADGLAPRQRPPHEPSRDGAVPRPALDDVDDLPEVGVERRPPLTGARVQEPDVVVVVPAGLRVRRGDADQRGHLAEAEDVHDAPAAVQHVEVQVRQEAREPRPAPQGDDRRRAVVGQRLLQVAAAPRVVAPAAAPLVEAGAHQRRVGDDLVVRADRLLGELHDAPVRAHPEALQQRLAGARGGKKVNDGGGHRPGRPMLYRRLQSRAARTGSPCVPPAIITA
jgi:hypothetical protein